MTKTSERNNFSLFKKYMIDDDDDDDDSDDGNAAAAAAAAAADDDGGDEVEDDDDDHGRGSDCHLCHLHVSALGHEPVVRENRPR